MSGSYLAHWSREHIGKLVITDDAGHEMATDRKRGTPPGSAGWDLGAEYLRALELGLRRHGMKCELDTRALWPRLRVYSPYEASPPSVAEFENSIVAARFDDGWWFAWLWAEKITEVTNIQTAADRIALELGPVSEARVTANRVMTRQEPGAGGVE